MYTRKRGVGEGKQPLTVREKHRLRGMISRGELPRELNHSFKNKGGETCTGQIGEVIEGLEGRREGTLRNRGRERPPSHGGKRKET